MAINVDVYDRGEEFFESVKAAQRLGLPWEIRMFPDGRRYLVIGVTKDKDFPNYK